MAGRKPIFDRDDQRKNQIVVPMSEQEKKMQERLKKLFERGEK